MKITFIGGSGRFGKIFPKILKMNGIINLEGETNSACKFAKKYNKKVKGIKSIKILKKKIPLNHSMNLKKLMTQLIEGKFFLAKS